MIDMPTAMTRNSETLADFVAYCEAHTNERFWHALRNWSGSNFVFVADVRPPLTSLKDTFYRKGRVS